MINQEKQESLINKLLALRSLTEKEFIKRMIEDLSCVYDKYLAFEAKAFSFWVLMLALPNKEKDFFDLLHDTYFQNTGLNKDQVHTIYSELGKRYEKYTKVYNSFVESKGSSAIGEVIVTMVKNKRTDFDSREDLIKKTLNDDLPKLDAFDTLKAFSIFDELFKQNIKIVGEINKDII